MGEIRFWPVGDRALAVEFGREVDESVNARVHCLAARIKELHDPAVIETVPAFATLLVHYEPAFRKYGPMCAWIRTILKQMSETETARRRIVKIPVCYGARFGADLHDMERLLHMDMDEIIAIHSARDYKVYMLGFLPGFPYLGGLDERIACPRLASPRVKIPAGSVGIGGSQTGIYPMASPGGWRLIGQTPLAMYDPNRKEPTLLMAGDYVRFVPVSLDEWYEIRRAVDRGEYEPEIIVSGVQADVEKKSSGSIRIAADEKTNLEHRIKLMVVNPGALTTVQDGGRFGMQALGITQCGAMDQSAWHLANRLVENDGSEAVLEMTVMGASFNIEGKGLIALTGADMQPKLNGAPVLMNQAIDVKSGDVLEMGAAVNGCRGYLAVSGGIDVAPVLGSRSTDLKGGIGGFCGRALRSGDVLYGAETPIIIGTKRLSTVRKPYRQSVTLRFIPGPQADMFSTEAMQEFLKAVYEVDAKSDRMGCRLEGPAIVSINGTDIVSDGIAAGSIQVPANGKPIVLMADHQTTGGYAKIGTVISEDLPKLAQMLPGGKVKFQAVTVEQVQKGNRK